jgi:hypothetical protein
MAENGRPPALGETERREIAAVLSTGCSIRVAANFVGCSRATIYRELANNPDFYDTIRRLQVAALLGPLKTLHEAATTNWRAAAWLTERLNPQDFGRRHPKMVDPEDIQLAGKVAMREIQEVIKDPKLLRKINRRMQRILLEGVHLKRSEKYRPRGPKPSAPNSASGRSAPPASLPSPEEDEDLDECSGDENGLDEVEARERNELNSIVDLVDELEREEIEEQEQDRKRSSGPPLEGD